MIEITLRSRCYKEKTLKYLKILLQTSWLRTGSRRSVGWKKMKFFSCHFYKYKNEQKNYFLFYNLLQISWLRSRWSCRRYKEKTWNSIWKFQPNLNIQDLQKRFFRSSGKMRHYYYWNYGHNNNHIAFTSKILVSLVRWRMRLRKT